MEASSFENLTLAQQVSLTVAPAVSATLSIFGSCCIIWMIASDWQKKISNVKYRFLLALSISDIVNSLVFLIWPIPMPSGTKGIWGAFGNVSTCQIQGFFMQMGVTGSFYNGALSLYFLLTLRYGLSNADIAKKYELWCHLVAILWPLVTGLVSASMQWYRVNAIGCFLGPGPTGCHLDDTDFECTTNLHATLFAWIFVGIPLVLINLFIAFAMIQIYRTVREITRKAQAYVFRNESQILHTKEIESTNMFSVLAPLGSQAQRKDRREETKSGDLPSNPAVTPSVTSSLTVKLDAQQKETALQAFLYVIAFFVTHFFAVSKYRTPNHLPQTPVVVC
jgi:hypothetical protein